MLPHRTEANIPYHDNGAYNKMCSPESERH